MKFSKIISKSLAIGLLLNSGLLNSFASTLSEDGRYETFKDTNITIEDTLEESKVDVEIEGNSLVNVLSCNSIKDFLSLGGKITDDGYIEIETDGSNFKNFFIKKDSIILKPNTKYTFFIDIAENTLTKVSDNENNATYAFAFGGSNDNMQNSPWTDRKLFNANTPVGVHKFTLTTKANFDNVVVGDRGFVNTGYSGKFKFRYMIIEGNYINKDIEYFKGMKSVGELEDNKLNITSESKEYRYNKIVFDTNDRFNYHLSNPIKSGTKVTNNSNKVITLLHYRENTDNWIKDIDVQPNSSYIIEEGLDVKIITFYTFRDWNKDNIPKLLSDVIEIDSGSYDKSLILLKEPLRGVPNGIKDRIIKKYGQWYIERNCGEVILDGSEDENWKVNSNYINDINTYYFSIEEILSTDKTGAKALLNDRFESIDALWKDEVEFDIPGIDISGSGKNKDIVIRLLRTDFVGNDIITEFRDYLNANPVKLNFILKSPVYEPININSSIQLFEDITYISNNSNIPANMKVVVDRVLNRALEAIELATINPTIDNLSRARMWTNLINESIKKDEFQGQINNITEIEDLEIINKNITANMDIYIKFQNALSMSVSTNSIFFENFTGVEDLENLNAINITVNSSLPYQLNSYLVDEIKNADNSKVIPKELLNIKLNGESNYKGFNNINEKLVLKDNCAEGNYNQFGIDLILRGSLTHKTDVYRTVIKFEVEQK